MILAGTGHRPDKLGGYSLTLEVALTDFAGRVLARQRPVGVISGMALGWDQALAVASVRLGIPFVAAIPFEGQESRWPSRAQREYAVLLGAASQVRVISDRDHYRNDHPDVAAYHLMQRRNEWMVDNSTGLLALWNGSKGGTFNCIQYAREGRREITNVWPEWEEWWESGSYLI